MLPGHYQLRAFGVPHDGATGPCHPGFITEWEEGGLAHWQLCHLMSLVSSGDAAGTNRTLTRRQASPSTVFPAKPADFTSKGREQVIE